MGVCGQRQVAAALPRGKRCRLGEHQNQSEWEWKNLSPIVIRSPDRPTCDESLDRLRCLGPHIINSLRTTSIGTNNINTNTNPIFIIRTTTTTTYYYYY